MGDRYHYDSRGNYTGKSSDNPPGSGIGGAIVLLVIIVICVKACSGSDSPPASTTSQSNTTQASVAPSTPAVSDSQTEQKPKWVIKD